MQIFILNPNWSKLYDHFDLNFNSNHFPWGIHLGKIKKTTTMHQWSHNIILNGRPLLIGTVKYNIFVSALRAKYNDIAGHIWPMDPWSGTRLLTLWSDGPHPLRSHVTLRSTCVPAQWLFCTLVSANLLEHLLGETGSAIIHVNFSHFKLRLLFAWYL